MLKLTRDDLVQICGPADGIRLFNALKSRCASMDLIFLNSHVSMPEVFINYMSVCRSVRPRLTVYVCQESPRDSPLLERHSSNENGERSVPSRLHGNVQYVGV